MGKPTLLGPILQALNDRSLRIFLNKLEYLSLVSFSSLV